MLWVMSLLLPNTELLLRCDFYLNLSLQICVSIYLYKDVSFGNFSLLASLSGMATHSDILEESTCHVVDLGWIPGLGRSPEEENSYPLQYSCLENSHGQRSLAAYSLWCCKDLDMTEQLRTAQDTWVISGLL